MASITKRGPFQFQVQVRRKGFKPAQKTFETKKEAEAWAATTESEMFRGLYVDRSEAERTTLGELLIRYEKEKTPGKKGRKAEKNRIAQLLRHPLALRKLATLRSVDFANYRDERSESVSSATVRLELALLSHVLTTAKKDWSIPVENCIKDIAKPAPSKWRNRRLLPKEERLLTWLAFEGNSNCLAQCIILAIETGMRAGEIVGLQWSMINRDHQSILLKETKNNTSRVVPLTVLAEELLKHHPRKLTSDVVMDYSDSSTLSNAFHKLCAKCGIEDLRFHDLRHEAASRLAPRMKVSTLAKVMGWKTIQMAMRYYNPTEPELVAAVRKEVWLNA
ncbi:site-specific integrase [uncultured Oxalicibacterium sp.]|uniref:site-specific integrase n=1 Tax=uncultured Oxalicibacterium sp. TaxID=1168540 RepID=UPI0025DAC642|nr:site-specific integrase [uncultured Oxalicibacterium sp.]